MQRTKRFVVPSVGGATRFAKLRCKFLKNVTVRRLCAMYIIPMATNNIAINYNYVVFDVLLILVQRLKWRSYAIRMERGINCTFMRKGEMIDALRLDDDSRHRVCNNDDAEIRDQCEQMINFWRDEQRHALSRPAGEDGDVQDSTNNESGSDDDNGVASSSAAAYDLDWRIQLEREKEKQSG